MRIPSIPGRSFITPKGHALVPVEQDFKILTAKIHEIFRRNGLEVTELTYDGPVRDCTPPLKRSALSISGRVIQPSISQRGRANEDDLLDYERAKLSLACATAGAPLDNDSIGLNTNGEFQITLMLWHELSGVKGSK